MVGLENQRVWFERWILKNASYKFLSELSKHSERTLQRRFSYYLQEALPFPIKPHKQSHLIIDGCYFPGNLCLIIYQDCDVQYTQLYRFSDAEHYQEIYEDLIHLKIFGVEIESITCDGHKSILKAIRKVYPQVKIQRCLFHLQSYCITRLTRFPKTSTGKELLVLAYFIFSIKSEQQKQRWLMDLIQWYNQHKVFLNQFIVQENSKKRFVHRKIRSAFYTLKMALPNMWFYLENPQIPSTTNPVEGFFSHLKKTLNVHRGLTMAHKRKFIKWYLHLKNTSQ